MMMIGKWQYSIKIACESSMGDVDEVMVLLFCNFPLYNESNEGKRVLKFIKSSCFGDPWHPIYIYFYVPLAVLFEFLFHWKVPSRQQRHDSQVAVEKMIWWALSSNQFGIESLEVPFVSMILSSNPPSWYLWCLVKHPDGNRVQW